MGYGQHIFISLGYWKKKKGSSSCLEGQILWHAPYVGQSSLILVFKLISCGQNLLELAWTKNVEFFHQFKHVL
jgi:hypothetical protein